MQLYLEKKEDVFIFKCIIHHIICILDIIYMGHYQNYLIVLVVRYNTEINKL